jgi:uncharacterized membrane protein YccC
MQKQHDEQPAAGSKMRMPNLLYWPKARQAIQTMVAAVAAYLVATYFAMPQGYWSVMTAILVVQANVGASLGLAFDRLLATLLGAATGAALVAAFGQSHPAAPLALAVIALAYIATFRPTLRLAPVTAAIVILGDPHYGTPLASAANRVIEIGIGAIIAVITALLLFPSRAGTTLSGHVGRMLPVFAEHLSGTINGSLGDGCLGTARTDETYVALNAQVRSGLSTGEGLVAEARRELAGHVTDHADPAAVQRTLRRLWYTLMMAARASQKPLPPEAARPLGPALLGVRDAGHAAITKLGALYRCEASAADIAPDLAAVTSALSALDAAMIALRQSHMLQPLPTDDAARIFALVYALGQLPQNLTDLADRHGDLTGNSGSTADLEPKASP